MLDPQPYRGSFSAVELPPESIGIVNEQQSLSVHWGGIGGCQDCEVAVHFDQPASQGWIQLDPPCFFGFVELPPTTGGQTRNVEGQPSNCNGSGPASGIFTYEFSVLPTQVDFYVWRFNANPEVPPAPISIFSTVSATVEVAALAPTLESLGMVLLAAGFVLAPLVGARPTGQGDRCRRLVA